MRIAIVHFHLRRGGVTRVIETATGALAMAEPEAEWIVLTGEPPASESPLAARHRVVHGLGYRDTCDAETAERLARDLNAAASDALGGPPDLWHFHNASLGKNVALPEVLSRLAASGAGLLLQIHDFAEDGRPENHRNLARARSERETTTYPDAGRIHYAVMNHRDARILARAGLHPERLHLLPHAIAPLPSEPSEPPDFARGRTFFLYPTRGIRRKNLGELLLLAGLTRDTHAWATTLTPENPRWQATHAHWVETTRRLALPVRFGLSGPAPGSLARLTGAADGIVTTSVSEGFGLGYLEPWLAGKGVRGRGLPEIADSFEGIHLEGLYPRLDVPVRWIDSNRLHEKLDRALHSSHAAYGRSLPDDAIERAYMTAVRCGRVDFGKLDEELQTVVLERALSDPRHLAEIERPDLSLPSEKVVSANAAAIDAGFGPSACGMRLAAIYRSVLASPATATESLDPDVILDAFLDAGRFSLLCH
jgi:glycosyltransferase involved in cell wall biosynthesis